VLLWSWEPFRDLDLTLACCPGSWHRLAMLDFPVSLGDCRFSADPDQPIVLHMSQETTYPDAGAKAFLNVAIDEAWRTVGELSA